MRLCLRRHEGLISPETDEKRLDRGVFFFFLFCRFLGESRAMNRLTMYMYDPSTPASVSISVDFNRFMDESRAEEQAADSYFEGAEE